MDIGDQPYILRLAGSSPSRRCLNSTSEIAVARICVRGKHQQSTLNSPGILGDRMERTSTTFSRPRKAAAIGLVRKNLDARDCGDER